MRIKELIINGFVIVGMFIVLTYVVAFLFNMGRYLINDTQKRHYSNGYIYVYAMPDINMFMHVHYYNDLIRVYFNRRDTIDKPCSYFEMKYYIQTTNIPIIVGADTTIYVIDHHDDITNLLCTQDIYIYPISKGYYNTSFFNKTYNEKSIPMYSFNKQYLSKIDIYYGVVHVNGSDEVPIKKYKDDNYQLY